MLEVLARASLAAPQDLQEILDVQRRAFLADGLPDAALRRDRLARLTRLIVDNAEALVSALSADFGHRSPVQSTMTDVLGILPAIKSDSKHLAAWMKPKRVSPGPAGWLGARGRIEWTPRGVVGIIAPWNFPVGLALQPLAQAFAAGNRAMVKVSEFTPATGDLLQSAIAKYFSPAEAVVVTGGPDVGAAFSALPFDLMFFTGATSIGRHVQRACAENLVPCVLELGGKSPVVLGPKADFAKAAKRLALGKTLNAGQICLSPDYVFAPQGREEEFADAMQAAISTLYPSLLNNDDFTSIINVRNRNRLLGYLEDARAKGARTIEINPAGENFSSGTGKLPPTLLLDVTPDMKVMQEEIFGPLLPIMGYRSIDDVITYVNARPRPLATYYFGGEDATCRRYLARTSTGGVTIDDVLLHAANENLPFGGVGDSGMGTYHGKAGFETFSYPRGIMKSGCWSANAMLSPPYGPRMKGILAWMLARQRKAIQRG